MTKSVVGVHEAKTQLSRLLSRVEQGEEVLIARRGAVIARLVPAEELHERRFGMDVGRVVLGDDFDAPLPDDVLADFDR